MTRVGFNLSAADAGARAAVDGAVRGLEAAIGWGKSAFINLGLEIAHLAAAGSARHDGRTADIGAMMADAYIRNCEDRSGSSPRGSANLNAAARRFSSSLATFTIHGVADPAARVRLKPWENFDNYLKRNGCPDGAALALRGRAGAPAAGPVAAAVSEWEAKHVGAFEAPQFMAAVVRALEPDTSLDPIGRTRLVAAVINPILYLLPRELEREVAAFIIGWSDDGGYGHELQDVPEGWEAKARNALAAAMWVVDHPESTDGDAFEEAFWTIIALLANPKGTGEARWSGNLAERVIEALALLSREDAALALAAWNLLVAEEDLTGTALIVGLPRLDPFPGGVLERARTALHGVVAPMAYRMTIPADAVGTSAPGGGGKDEAGAPTPTDAALGVALGEIATHPGSDRAGRAMRILDLAHRAGVTWPKLPLFLRLSLMMERLAAEEASEDDSAAFSRSLPVEEQVTVGDWIAAYFAVPPYTAHTIPLLMAFDRDVPVDDMLGDLPGEAHPQRDPRQTARVIRLPLQGEGGVVSLDRATRSAKGKGAHATTNGQMLPFRKRKSDEDTPTPPPSPAPPLKTLAWLIRLKGAELDQKLPLIKLLVSSLPAEEADKVGALAARMSSVLEDTISLLGVESPSDEHPPPWQDMSRRSGSTWKKFADRIEAHHDDSTELMRHGGLFALTMSISGKAGQLRSLLAAIEEALPKKGGGPGGGEGAPPPPAGVPPADGSGPQGAPPAPQGGGEAARGEDPPRAVIAMPVALFAIRRDSPPSKIQAAAAMMAGGGQPGHTKHWIGFWPQMSPLPMPTQATMPLVH